MFADSHVHMSYYLYDNSFPYLSTEGDGIVITDGGTREDLINKIKSHVALCIEPGIDIESNYKLLNLSRLHDGYLFPTVGVHPTRAINTEWKRRKEIELLSLEDSVVGIGELGLDYHYERKKQHRMKQIAWFVWQLNLAHSRRLPLVLHIRKADRDAIRILRVFKHKLHGGICHCFNGSLDAARIYTEELGLSLGIGGSLLQKGCAQLEQVVQSIPLESIVLETDCPYVLPCRPDGITKSKWSKVRNTPLLIPEIAKKVAALKGLPLETVEKVTTENTIRIFHLQERIQNE